MPSDIHPWLFAAAAAASNYSIKLCDLISLVRGSVFAGQAVLRVADQSCEYDVNRCIMRDKSSKRQRKQKSTQSLKRKQHSHQSDVFDLLAEDIQEEAGFAGCVIGMLQPLWDTLILSTIRRCQMPWFSHAVLTMAAVTLCMHASY
jgi:hypothetical protein